MFSSLLKVTCLAALALAYTPATSATPPSFPPLRHGVKALFGPGGGDFGGNLETDGRRLVEAMTDLKSNLTRVTLAWAQVEATRGRYDWAEIDRLIDFLAKNDIEPMAMICCAPAWARQGSPKDYDFLHARGEGNLYTVIWPRLEYMADFERFCEATARRYAGKIRFYEFWNEPDGMGAPIVLHDRDGNGAEVRWGGNASEYTRWLRAIYPAIKRGNPDAAVAGGSLCVHDLRFIEAMYAAGARDACDAISLHPYSHSGVNLDWIKQCREVMTAYGDWHKPIWLTEFGWVAEGDRQPGGPGYTATPEGQARLIKEAFAGILTLPYVTQTYLFTLNDWSTGEGPDGLWAFGLLDLNLQPRLSYHVFKQVVAETPREPRQGERPRPTVAPPPGPVDLRADGSAGLPLIFCNPAGQPREVVVGFKGPDILARPVERRIAVKPGSLSHPITLPIRPDAVPGSWPLEIIHEGQTPIRTEITVPAPARRAGQPPVIDGKLDEWADHLSIRQENMEAGFMWDKERVYFACRIVDPTHEQTYKGRDIWRGDSVQLAFDPARDAVRMSSYDHNDTELALALTEEGPLMWRYACPTEQYYGPLPEHYVAIRREGDHTLYEAALPWRELGLPDDAGPAVGQIIGVSIAGCDWDAGQRTLYRFGDGIIAGKIPSRFAAIVLR